MADEEMLLSLCASSVVAVIMKRRQKRRKNRKIWTREWLRNRTIFGAYYTLLAELRNLDISSSLFQILLQSLSVLYLSCHGFLWSFDIIAYRHGKVSYRLISWLVLSKLHSNSNSADSNSSAAMLILPRNHVTPNSKNDWFKPFNSRQLVERNRAKFYFRSTTFNNFQHVERQISTFNITWYTVNICWTAATTFVAQQMLNRVSLA